MKTIALGDIHGNLPALEACFEQAQAEGYDWIVHTGDVVGYGPFPGECVEFLHHRNIPGARGNFDENVGLDGDESGAADTDPAEKSLADATFRWTRETLDLWCRRWLSDLPFEVRLEGDGKVLAVYHAGPVDLLTHLGQDTSESRFIETGQEARADVIVVGHGDRPFHRGAGRYEFVNPGSVGRPRDGSPQTGYAVIETDSGSSTRVTLKRFPYDVDRTLKAIEERGLPKTLANRLASGS